MCDRGTIPLDCDEWTENKRVEKYCIDFRCTKRLWITYMGKKVLLTWYPNVSDFYKLIHSLLHSMDVDCVFIGVHESMLTFQFCTKNGVD